MKLEALNEVKKQLKGLDSEELLAIVLRLAKHKKENKELLQYLLTYKSQETLYIDAVKAMIDEAFAIIEPNKGAYVFAKQVRKVLRVVNKHIKFSQLPTTELELLIHFCQQLQAYAFADKPITAILLIYDRQLIRIDKTLTKLHEDLVFDYRASIEALALKA
ncbi:MAG: hypothetical protein RLZZ318_1683 [Bacteroidota bacterium]|jgi:DNA repair protein RadC